jgi:hypothetical protein
MLIPSTVNQIPISRARARRRRDDIDNEQPSAELGIGGITLDHGRIGGAGLTRRKGLWRWNLAGEETGNLSA